MEKTAHIFKMALLIVIALFLSHRLGKGAMDSLVDSDIGGTLWRVVAAIACLVVLILLLVVDKENRISWAITTVLCIGCFFFGFYYWVYHNPNVGLKVKWDNTVGTQISDLAFDESRPETGYDLYLPAQKSFDGSSFRRWIIL